MTSSKRTIWNLLFANAPYFLLAKYFWGKNCPKIKASKMFKRPKILGIQSIYSTMKLREVPKLLVAFVGLFGTNSGLDIAFHTVCNGLIEFVIFSYWCIQMIIFVLLHSQDFMMMFLCHSSFLGANLLKLCFKEVSEIFLRNLSKMR